MKKKYVLPSMLASVPLYQGSRQAFRGWFCTVWLIAAPYSALFVTPHCMVKVKSLLIKAGSRHEFSFGVRAWIEMEIWCVKGMWHVYAKSNLKWKKFKV